MSVGCLIGFSYKGWVEWHIYADSDKDEDKIKVKRGKLYFFGGILATMLILTVGMILCKLITDSTSAIEDVISSSADDSSIDDSSFLIEDPTSDSSFYYVTDKQYNGATYTGYVDKETMLPDGQGKMIYNNGNVYDGDWVEGIQEGRGFMLYYNGDTYDGLWKGGEKSGSGVYSWKDGKKYDGEYKDDKRDGEGIYTGWTGYVSTYGWIGNYYGSNKEDTFEGYGRFEFDNGDKFEGIFSANKFWNGVYTKSDGAEYKIIDGEIAR